MTLPGFTAPDPTPLSRDRKRTLDQRRSIERGVHPFGRRLAGPGDLGNGRTCGQCHHARKADAGRRDVWKCDISRLTHSATTDLRLNWPACAAFSPGERQR